MKRRFIETCDQQMYEDLAVINTPDDRIHIENSIVLKYIQNPFLYNCRLDKLSISKQKYILECFQRERDDKYKSFKDDMIILYNIILLFKQDLNGLKHLTYDITDYMGKDIFIKLDFRKQYVHYDIDLKEIVRKNRYPIKLSDMNELYFISLKIIKRKYELLQLLEIIDNSYWVSVNCWTYDTKLDYVFITYGRSGGEYVVLYLLPNGFNGIMNYNIWSRKNPICCDVKYWFDIKLNNVSSLQRNISRCLL